MHDIPPAVPCSMRSSLPRRAASMFYDSLLLLSAWFIATVIILPFTGGEAVGSDNMLYSFYLFAIAGAYFTWQWRHGGQTLGMRAWRIQLVTMDQKPVSWQTAIIRFLLATVSTVPFAAGFFWALLDRDALALHDRWSGTCLRVISR